MSENHSNKANARRKLLKSIAAGSGAVIAGKTLPESWSRPVVDSMMLPAHAQTSFVPRSFTNILNGTAIEPDSQFAGVLDGLVNEAHAGPGNGLPTPTYTQRSCIRENADGTVRVDALISDGYPLGTFNAPSVPVDGTLVSMSGNPCGMIMVVPPDASLLDPLRLIPDAYAGVLVDSVQVAVDTLNGSAIGRYVISLGTPFNLPFNLPLGDCGPPECPLIDVI